jgi:hypothetical protein
MAAKKAKKKGGSAIYYAGIDYHKRYSVVSIQDAQGTLYVTRSIPYQASLDFLLRLRVGWGRRTVRRGEIRCVRQLVHFACECACAR